MIVTKFEDVLGTRESATYVAKLIELDIEVLTRLPQVMDVNTNGVLFTAQAAGRQMARFGNGGSIILVASMSGSITNKVCCIRVAAP